MKMHNELWNEGLVDFHACKDDNEWSFTAHQDVFRLMAYLPFCSDDKKILSLLLSNDFRIQICKTRTTRTVNLSTMDNQYPAQIIISLDIYGPVLSPFKHILRFCTTTV